MIDKLKQLGMIIVLIFTIYSGITNIFLHHKLRAQLQINLGLQDDINQKTAVLSNLSQRTEQLKTALAEANKQVDKSKHESDIREAKYIAAANKIESCDKMAKWAASVAPELTKVWEK